MSSKRLSISQNAPRHPYTPCSGVTTYYVYQEAAGQVELLVTNEFKNIFPTSGA